MSRDEATEQLANKPHGTYLIRMSVVATRRGEYALSIKFVTISSIVVQTVQICFLSHINKENNEAVSSAGFV